MIAINNRCQMFGKEVFPLQQEACYLNIVKIIKTNRYHEVCAPTISPVSHFSFMIFRHSRQRKCPINLALSVRLFLRLCVRSQRKILKLALQFFQFFLHGVRKKKKNVEALFLKKSLVWLGGPKKPQKCPKYEVLGILTKI